jgi:hypothetical protein
LHGNPGAAATAEVAHASNPQKTETEVVTRVSFSEKGPCERPGFPELDGQTWVHLTYVEWPQFFDDFCSSDLAAHLRKSNAKEVPVTVSFNSQRGGHSICAIDGIVGRRLERGGCLFDGVLSGGSSGGGYSQLNRPLTDADMPPWALAHHR